MRLWPSVDETTRLAWAGAAGGLPACGALVAALRPALRALFLQGYRTHSVAFLPEPRTQPATWQILDVTTLELFEAERSHVATGSSLEIVFETEPLNDLRGPAPSGYALAGVPLAIGFDGTSTDGDAPSAELLAELEAFAAAAVDRLVALVSGSVPRGDGQGLLWLFNPVHQLELEPRNGVASYEVFRELESFPFAFIPAQVFDDQRRYGPRPRLDASEAPPCFRWLGRVANAALQDFWPALRRSLENRGESQRVPRSVEDRLASPNGPSWLDALTELASLGALEFDGLIEADELGEPLVATLRALDDGSEVLDLVIWGETRILVTRTTRCVNPARPGGYSTSVTGSVAFDYRDNLGGRPKLLLVASRGIRVAAPSSLVAEPWDFELYRVQDDALVPRTGAAIQPNNFLGTATIDPHADQDFGAAFHSTQSRVVARGKPDGLFLEFPAAASSGDRFILELTLEDPFSGNDGYNVGVYYYDYSPAAGLPAAIGVHICVWATAGVRIESNGTGFEGDQACGSTFFETAWTASAEFWELDPVPGIERLNIPFRGELQFTRRLAFHDTEIDPTREPFSDEFGVQVVIDGDLTLARLTPKTFTAKGYDDSLAYLVFDILIGLIPGYGDLVDMTELTLAYWTGMDKWGRPVTNLDLALMTIGSLVPLVSNSFVRGVGDGIASAADDVLHGRELQLMYQHAVGGWNVASRNDVAEAAAKVSLSWTADRRFMPLARELAVEDLLTFFGRAAPELEAIGRRLAGEAREAWLTIDDVYDAADDGFEIVGLELAYRRWQGRNAGLQDPEAFLRSLDDATLQGASAKIVAEALLGPQALTATRRTPRTGLCPSDARYYFGGDPIRLEMLSPRAWAQVVDETVEQVLAPASGYRIVDSAMLRPVDEIVQGADQDFVREAAERLMQEPLALPAHESIDGLVATLGNNTGEITEVERARRFAVALCVAVAEMRRNLLDPRLLLGDDLLPELRHFVCGFINRKNELGARFELSKIAEFDTRLVAHPDVEAVHAQLRMLHQGAVPGYRTYLSGPDIALYLRTALGRRVAFVQLKAFHDLTDLAWYASNAFVRATGPDSWIIRGGKLFKQATTDALRVNHPDWQRFVPGPGFVGALSETPASSIDDWVRSGNVHVFQIDDVLLMDYLSSLVMRATRLNGMQVIFGRHLRDLGIASPGEVRMFDALFPDGVPSADDDMIRNLIYSDPGWLDAWLEATEQLLNAQVAAHVEPLYGEALTFLVRRGSVDPAEIVGDILARLGGG